MNTPEAIYTRRSIRKFLAKDIPDAILLKILRSGMYAPSAHNEQPWHFIVIKNRQISEKEKLPENLTFQKEFGELMRQVEGLSNSLKMYNEGLFDKGVNSKK